MADHHMVREIERGGMCIYCNNDLSGAWESDFAGSKHYKCTICKCGKENCVEVDYYGSGHDSWSGLEKKVTASEHIKVLEPRIKRLSPL